MIHLLHFAHLLCLQFLSSMTQLECWLWICLQIHATLFDLSFLVLILLIIWEESVRPTRVPCLRIPQKLWKNMLMMMNVWGKHIHYSVRFIEPSLMSRYNCFFLLHLSLYIYPYIYGFFRIIHSFNLSWARYFFSTCICVIIWPYTWFLVIGVWIGKSWSM